jgi:hypothetical protein
LFQAGGSVFINYFFLNPAGHLGAGPDTFFIDLPLTHVIVFVEAAGFENFTEMLGAE